MIEAKPHAEDNRQTVWKKPALRVRGWLDLSLGCKLLVVLFCEITSVRRSPNATRHPSSVDSHGSLFSFRELPPLMKAFEKLQTVPQLIVCDGQGIAHPRRFGLASHVGLLYDIPAIGCGKTRLLGEYAQPDSHRGACSPLLDEGEIVGAVLRTQADTKPVFVSVGHGISLPTACEWITRLAPKYRLPETTRQVDQLVNKALAGLGN